MRTDYISCLNPLRCRREKPIPPFPAEALVLMNFLQRQGRWRIGGEGSEGCKIVNIQEFEELV